MLKLWQCAEGLGVKALTMCRKSCLLIYFFKKLVGTFERNFCPRGENFNKAIFKSSNTWGAARKKREGYQRFQLIVILLIKGIKIKTIMWLSICIFLIWKYENMTVAIQLLTVSRAITRTMATWSCKDLFINYLLSHFRGE